MAKTPFMDRELKELRRLIAEKKEENIHRNSQEAYGYHVNPKTGKLVSSQPPRRRVVKVIRLKKSKSLNSPIVLGKE